MALENVVFKRGAFSLEIPRLDLQPGRIYLLEGPNGAGKSTFLQLLALLEPPTTGTIRFRGEPVVEEVQRQRYRRQITLVDQNPYLFDKSVYQNLALGLRLRDVRGDLQRRRITQALRMVDLEGFGCRPARALSGGESRRVALARAMVLSPKLLLLDEPTAGLDKDVLPIFERCLCALSEEGVTLVIAGHDADQARRLSGRILKLDHGRLVEASEGPLTRQKEIA